MKQLTLIDAVEELSLLPANASLQIYWEPQTGFVYILDTKEKAGVPASATLIANGNPDRFFDLLHQLLTRYLLRGSSLAIFSITAFTQK